MTAWDLPRKEQFPLFCPNCFSEEIMGVIIPPNIIGDMDREYLIEPFEHEGETHEGVSGFLCFDCKQLSFRDQSFIDAPEELVQAAEAEKNRKLEAGEIEHTREANAWKDNEEDPFQGSFLYTPTATDLDTATYQKNPKAAIDKIIHDSINSGAIKELDYAIEEFYSYGSEHLYDLAGDSTRDAEARGEINGDEEYEVYFQNEIDRLYSEGPEELLNYIRLTNYASDQFYKLVTAPSRTANAWDNEEDHFHPQLIPNSICFECKEGAYLFYQRQPFSNGRQDFYYESICPNNHKVEITGVHPIFGLAEPIDFEQEFQNMSWDRFVMDRELLDNMERQMQWLDEKPSRMTGPRKHLANAWTEEGEAKSQMSFGPFMNCPDCNVPFELEIEDDYLPEAYPMQWVLRCPECGNAAPGYAYSREEYSPEYLQALDFASGQNDQVPELDYLEALRALPRDSSAWQEYIYNSDLATEIVDIAKRRNEIPQLIEAFKSFKEEVVDSFQELEEMNWEYLRPDPDADPEEAEYIDENGDITDDWYESPNYRYAIEELERNHDGMQALNEIQFLLSSYMQREARTAAATTKKLLEQKAQIENEFGPDTSLEIARDEEGWSIRQPQTYADVNRIGCMMGNCWALTGSDEYLSDIYDSHPERPNTDPFQFWEDDPDLDIPLEDSVMFLMDPNGIPRLAWNALQGGFQDILGRHNSNPKPEYIDRINSLLEGTEFVPDQIFAPSGEYSDWPDREADYVPWKDYVDSYRPNAAATTPGPFSQQELITNCPNCGSEAVVFPNYSVQCPNCERRLEQDGSMSVLPPDSVNAIRNYMRVQRPKTADNAWTQEDPQKGPNLAESLSPNFSCSFCKEPSYLFVAADERIRHEPNRLDSKYKDYHNICTKCERHDLTERHGDGTVYFHSSQLFPKELEKFLWGDAKYKAYDKYKLVEDPKEIEDVIALGTRRVNWPVERSGWGRDVKSANAWQDKPQVEGWFQRADYCPSCGVSVGKMRSVGNNPIVGFKCDCGWLGKTDELEARELINEDAGRTSNVWTDETDPNQTSISDELLFKSLMKVPEYADQINAKIKENQDKLNEFAETLDRPIEVLKGLTPSTDPLDVARSLFPALFTENKVLWEQGWRTATVEPPAIAEHNETHWDTGNCVAYAMALMKEYPWLRGATCGVLYNEVDDDVFDPYHFFCVDLQGNAYDVVGKRSIEQMVKDWDGDLGPANHWQLDDPEAYIEKLPDGGWDMGFGWRHENAPQEARKLIQDNQTKLLEERTSNVWEEETFDPNQEKLFNRIIGTCPKGHEALVNNLGYAQCPTCVRTWYGPYQYSQYSEITIPTDQIFDVIEEIKSNDWVKEAAAQNTYYHVAPSSAREEIAKNGLIAQEPRANKYHEEPQPAGVYVWTDQKSAEMYALDQSVQNEAQDIWEIDAPPIYELDPIHGEQGKSRYISADQPARLIKTITKDDAEEFGRWGKTAAMTRTKKLEQAQTLEQEFGPDTSEIVYTFDDGWTIRKLITFGDAQREGNMMGNCMSCNLEMPHIDISPVADFWRNNDSYRNFENQYEEAIISNEISNEKSIHWPSTSELGIVHDIDWSAPIGWGAEIYSLRDPDNLPHITMYDDAGDEQVLGRHNSMPSEELIPKLKEFADSEMLWDKGIKEDISFLVHMYEQPKTAAQNIYYHTAPSHLTDKIEREGLRPSNDSELIEEHGVDGIHLWATEEQARRWMDETGNDALWEVFLDDSPQYSMGHSHDIYPGSIPPDRIKRVSAQKTYYHVAPTQVREQIAQEGLRTDLARYPESQPGVYGWKSLDSAHQWKEYLEEEEQESFDIWEIQGWDPSIDPWADQDSSIGFLPSSESAYDEGPISPDRIKRIGSRQGVSSQHVGMAAANQSRSVEQFQGLTEVPETPIRTFVPSESINEEQAYEFANLNTGVLRRPIIFTHTDDGEEIVIVGHSGTRHPQLYPMLNWPYEDKDYLQELQGEVMLDPDSPWGHGFLWNDYRIEALNLQDRMEAIQQSVSAITNDIEDSGETFYPIDPSNVQHHDQDMYEEFKKEDELAWDQIDRTSHLALQPIMPPSKPLPSHARIAHKPTEVNTELFEFLADNESVVKSANNWVDEPTNPNQLALSVCPKCSNTEDLVHVPAQNIKDVNWYEQLMCPKCDTAVIYNPLIGPLIRQGFIEAVEKAHFNELISNDEWNSAQDNCRKYFNKLISDTWPDRTADQVLSKTANAWDEEPSNDARLTPRGDETGLNQNFLDAGVFESWVCPKCYGRPVDFYWEDVSIPDDHYRCKECGHIGGQDDLNSLWNYYKQSNAWTETPSNHPQLIPNSICPKCGDSTYLFGVSEAMPRNLWLFYCPNGHAGGIATSYGNKGYILDFIKENAPIDLKHNDWTLYETDQEILDGINESMQNRHKTANAWEEVDPNHPQLIPNSICPSCKEPAYLSEAGFVEAEPDGYFIDGYVTLVSVCPDNHITYMIDPFGQSEGGYGRVYIDATNAFRADTEEDALDHVRWNAMVHDPTTLERVNEAITRLAHTGGMSRGPRIFRSPYGTSPDRGAGNRIPNPIGTEHSGNVLGKDSIGEVLGILKSSSTEIEDELEAKGYDLNDRTPHQECYEVARCVDEDFPDWEYTEGAWERGPDDLPGHAWNTAPDGTIIDLSFSQFDPNKGYQIVSPGTPEYDRYLPWHYGDSRTIESSIGPEDSKTAALTRQQLLEMAADLGQDSSRVLAELSDGWTIRAPMTLSDYNRESGLMSNCIGPILDGPDEMFCHNGEILDWRNPDHRNLVVDDLGIASLRDPDNIPRLMGYVKGPNVPGKDLVGRNNSWPKEEYWNRWNEYEDLGAWRVPEDSKISRNLWIEEEDVVPLPNAECPECGNPAYGFDFDDALDVDTYFCPSCLKQYTNSWAGSGTIRRYQPFAYKDEQELYKEIEYFLTEHEEAVLKTSGTPIWEPADGTPQRTSANIPEVIFVDQGEPSKSWLAMTAPWVYIPETNTVYSGRPGHRHADIFPSVEWGADDTSIQGIVDFRVPDMPTFVAYPDIDDFTEAETEPIRQALSQWSGKDIRFEWPGHDEAFNEMYDKAFPPRQGSSYGTPDLSRFVGVEECTEIAQAIENEYPELRVDAGFYLDQGQWKDHAWNVGPDGTIYDATHGQFDPDVPLYIGPNDGRYKSFRNDWEEIEEQGWDGEKFASNLWLQRDDEAIPLPNSKCPKCESPAYKFQTSSGTIICPTCMKKYQGHTTLEFRNQEQLDKTLKQYLRGYLMSGYDVHPSDRTGGVLTGDWQGRVGASRSLWKEGGGVNYHLDDEEDEEEMARWEEYEEEMLNHENYLTAVEIVQDNWFKHDPEQEHETGTEKPWKKGNWGKGMIVKGKPVLWSVSKEGFPHHFLVADDYSDAIWISPDGAFTSANWINDEGLGFPESHWDTNLELVSKAYEPLGLRHMEPWDWVAEYWGGQEGGYGHARNLRLGASRRSKEAADIPQGEKVFEIRQPFLMDNEGNMVIGYMGQHHEDLDPDYVQEVFGLSDEAANNINYWQSISPLEGHILWLDDGPHIQWPSAVDASKWDYEEKLLDYAKSILDEQEWVNGQ